MNTTITENWVITRKAEELKTIHDTTVNIAIWNRPIDYLNPGIASLLRQELEIRVSGSIENIVNTVSQKLKNDSQALFRKDIRHLINIFADVSGSKSFKLFLATSSTDMCRRFHYDMNDLRMLCTYAGPGTLWLKEDNVNRSALDCQGDNESIVNDYENIQQAQEGDVLILKGARYPDNEIQAIVHRSPTIEESGKKRLLLRLDTNDF